MWREASCFWPSEFRGRNANDVRTSLIEQELAVVDIKPGYSQALLGKQPAPKANLRTKTMIRPGCALSIFVRILSEVAVRFPCVIHLRFLVRLG